MRARQGRSRTSGLLLSIALSCSTAAIALASCSADPADQPSVAPMAPASSSDRAEARSQRALRKIAAAEIDPSARSRRPPPEPAPTLPPPKPETLPEEVVDAGPPDAEPDATPADAARDAVADSEATAAADPCEPLCERISRCALDRFPPGMDPSILDRLRESIERGRERCVEECRAEIRLNGDSKAEDAQACLAIEDCEALMECVSNLMSGGM